MARFESQEGISSRTSNRLIYDLTDKEKEAAFLVNTDHSSNSDKSYQGFFKFILQPQLRHGNRVELTKDQMGLCITIMNEQRGIFGKAARMCMGRAIMERWGAELIEATYHGSTEALVEEHLHTVSDKAVRKRAEALAAKEGHFSQEAEHNKVDE